MNHNHDGPVASGSADMLNPEGDEQLSRLGGRTLRFRCKSCGVPCQAFALETSPVVAKYRCRRCDYVMEVKTRAESMDTIEGHIEEGAYEQRIKDRTDGSRGSRRPTSSSQYISPSEKVLIEKMRGAYTTVKTPWGPGTVIGE